MIQYSFFLITPKMNESIFTFIFTIYHNIQTKIELLEMIINEKNKKHIYNLKNEDKYNKSNNVVKVIEYLQGDKRYIKRGTSKILRLTFNQLTPNYYNLFRIKPNDYTKVINPYITEKNILNTELIKGMPSDLEDMNEKGYKLYCVFKGFDLHYICYYDISECLKEILFH